MLDASGARQSQRSLQFGGIPPLLLLILAIIGITVTATVALVEAWDKYQEKAKGEQQVKTLTKENEDLRAENEKLRSQLGSGIMVDQQKPPPAAPTGSDSATGTLAADGVPESVKARGKTEDGTKADGMRSILNERIRDASDPKLKSGEK